MAECGKRSRTDCETGKLAGRRMRLPALLRPAIVKEHGFGKFAAFPCVEAPACDIMLAWTTALNLGGGDDGRRARKHEGDRKR